MSGSLASGDRMGYTLSRYHGSLTEREPSFRGRAVPKRPRETPTPTASHRWTARPTTSASFNPDASFPLSNIPSFFLQPRLSSTLIPSSPPLFTTGSWAQRSFRYRLACSRRWHREYLSEAFLSVPRMMSGGACSCDGLNAHPLTRGQSPANATRAASVNVERHYSD